MLENVTFDLPARAVIATVGENGAGKPKLAGTFQDLFHFELPARQSIGVGRHPAD